MCMYQIVIKTLVKRLLKYLLLKRFISMSKKLNTFLSTVIPALTTVACACCVYFGAGKVVTTVITAVGTTLLGVVNQIPVKSE